MTTPSPLPGGSRRTGRALDRQVVRFAATCREDDLTGPGTEGCGHRLPSLLEGGLRGPRTIACPPDGLPKVPDRNGVMAATASGRMGVVAAKSR